MQEYMFIWEKRRIGVQSTPTLTVDFIKGLDWIKMWAESPNTKSCFVASACCERTNHKEVDATSLTENKSRFHYSWWIWNIGTWMMTWHNSFIWWRNTYVLLASKWNHLEGLKITFCSYKYNNWRKLQQKSRKRSKSFSSLIPVSSFLMREA